VGAGPKASRTWSSSLWTRGTQGFEEGKIYSQEVIIIREMNVRGLGFLADVLFGSYHALLPPFSKLCLFLSLPVCCQSSLLTREGERGWGRSQIIQGRESLVLYNPLTTLWLQCMYCKYLGHVFMRRLWVINRSLG
jgi:hypothetical protein